MQVRLFLPPSLPPFLAPSLPSICTVDEFRWAWMCVCSQNFGLEVDMIRTAALMPYAGMFLSSLPSLPPSLPFVVLGVTHYFILQHPGLNLSSLPPSPPDMLNHYRPR